ncbi:DUF4870 domain-containing protein [Alkalihalobacillus macyae]|uniref:DUF4870 domain-containing protein n=1 Tax=Guptibacillus hwajinpoensis TaxID=208199 RepID=UPI00273CC866|nr:DUF4870 domain-containing protein [Alkalihalobacillus macyae]MDP4551814.1 DUF4870 domain-containing protein [Alkalihalobacillus macyae]
MEKDATIPNQEARTWAMFAHLSGLSGYLIPFGNIVGPLVIWSIKRETDPFIDTQGKEALNFQITMMIYTLILGILSIVIIGLILLPALFVLHLVFIIIASVKSNQGEDYRYPLTIRFVS